MEIKEEKGVEVYNAYLELWEKMIKIKILVEVVEQQIEELGDIIEVARRVM